jgi:hypothetical protein
MTNAEINIRKMSQEKEIAEKNLAETRRSNKAKEFETNRSNSARERETERSNKMKEKQNKQGLAQSALSTVYTTERGIAQRKGEQALKMLPQILGLVNDPQFYTKGNEELVKDITPTNFGNIFGIPTAQTTPSGVKWYTRHPGVAVLSYQNTVGVANSARSPINKVGNKLFTTIQQHTNYAKSYQPADVMLMMLAYREVITLAHFCAKMLKLAASASTSTAYLPKSIVEACGIDYEDLRNNYPLYKKKIHLALVDASQLNIPKVTLFDRAAQMASGIYRDHDVDSLKTGIITFRPHSWGKYVISGEEEAVGEIKFTTLTAGTHSLSEEISAMESAIDSILNYTEFKNISGDIARTFTDFWNIVDVDLESPAQFVYDEYTLSQIRNASLPFYGMTAATEDFTISQDTSGGGYLEAKPAFRTTATGAIPNDRIIQTPIINLTDKVAVTSDYVIDATRLMFTFAGQDVLNENTILYPLLNCGVEVITKSTVCYLDESDNLIKLPVVNYPYITELNNAASFMRSGSVSLQMTHIPKAYGTVRANSGFEWFIDFRDMDNYRAFDVQTITLMHLAASYTLFGLNSVGTTSTF